MTGVVQNSWKFDIDKLKSELQHVLEDNAETGGEGSLTGIALTSKTGDIFNGFEYNLNIMYPPYAVQTRTNTYPEIYFDLDECRRSGVYHMLDYDVPTDALTGYFKEVYNFLIANNCNPRRMRLSCLTPSRSIPLHSDGGGYKIHIPIITNPDIIFTVADIDYTMEEGSTYCVDVGLQHTVHNCGTTDRWHLICDMYDTGSNFEIGSISNEQFNLEQRNADLWRSYVDSERDNEPKLVRIGIEN